MNSQLSRSASGALRWVLPVLLCLPALTVTAERIEMFEGSTGSACGDSLLSPGEQCDDGNESDGDGCSATCLVEQPNWVCTDPGMTTQDAINGLMADAIQQGGFEDARGRPTTTWSEVALNSGDPLLSICSEILCPDMGDNVAADGVFAAVFRSIPNLPFSTDRSIRQELIIPLEASTLTFDLSVASCDSPTDRINISIDGDSIFLLLCDTLTDGFETQTLDISAFADGQVHDLRINPILSAASDLGTLIVIDNVSIPLPFAATPRPSECQTLNTACGPVETFDEGIPAPWTLITLSANPTEGWGTTLDDLCLSRNAAGLPAMTNQNLGTNLTTGANGALCADSDASGQNADDLVAGSATEMDTYICSPAQDLSTITGPEYTFNTYYQSKDSFDDNDFLRVLVGTVAPDAQSVGNYSVAYEVQDHEDNDLLLTGAQEISVNLEGSALEGAAEGYVCFHYRGTFAWFAQVDNTALRGEDCFTPPADTDGDGVFDSTDNCTLIPNASQIDTNNDGIGNMCDPDINSDCIIAFIDIASYPPKFNSAVGDPQYDENFDINSDGIINFVDYLTFIQFFGQSPGPSANPCVPGLGT
ncbi:MAG: DUF4215 domain-containing protein [Gammaproteobacteria bacterium]